MQTDASERGLGAVLSQADHQGRDYPIAYASRKLLPREMRHSIIEKECIGLCIPKLNRAMVLQILILQFYSLNLVRCRM